MLKIRCSSLPRIELCPGSLNACECIASADTAQSLAGAAGHAALEQYYNNHSSSPHVESFTNALDGMTASRCMWYSKQIDTLIESHGGAKKIITEHEMVMHVSEGIDLTGHADLIVICNDGVHLVIDYKFNNLEVPRASRNLQIMGYVLLWSNECPDTHEIHGILAAGGNEEPFTAAVYTPIEIDVCMSVVKRICKNSSQPYAPRNQSEEACKYCSAKCSTRCPETLEQVGKAIMPMPDAMLPASKADVVTLWNKAKQLDGLIKAYTERVKEAVKANPEEWAEYFMLQGTGATRTIKDAQKAYYQFVEATGMIDAEKFLSLVSLPVTKLEEACKPALIVQGYPVKEHKARIAEILGDNLELKEKEPSVKAVK